MGHNGESFLKSSGLRATCRGGGRMARTTRARAPADDGAARARVPPGHLKPSLGRAGDASESRRPSLSRLRAAGPARSDRGFRATPGQASGRTCPDSDRRARGNRAGQPIPGAGRPTSEWPASVSPGAPSPHLAVACQCGRDTPHPRGAPRPAPTSMYNLFTEISIDLCFSLDRLCVLDTGLEEGYKHR